MAALVIPDLILRATAVLPNYQKMQWNFALMSKSCGMHNGLTLLYMYIASDYLAKESNFIYTHAWAAREW